MYRKEKINSSVSLEENNMDTGQHGDHMAISLQTPVEEILLNEVGSTLASRHIYKSHIYKSLIFKQ